MQTRSEKAEIIADIREKAGRASIALVTDFKGLSVEDLTGLRDKLRPTGADFMVVKNTLARKAMEGLNHESIASKLKENCAIAFGYDDPVAVAKAVIEYGKLNKNFVVRFASLEGKVLSADGIKALSMLPGRNELLSSLLGTLNAVPTNFVSLLANVPRGLLNVLTALKDKREEGGAAAA